MKLVKYILIIILFNIPTIESQCIGEKDLEYGCDTIQTKNNRSNYTEYYKQGSFKDAYEPWEWLVTNAPKSTKNLYIHGPKMLRALIEKTENEIEKQKLIDVLIGIYDKRLYYYPGKEGYVLALKGKDMYKYRSSTIEELKQCRSVLKESFLIDGLNSTATTINYYFIVSLKLFQKKELNQQDLMTLFSDVSEVVDYREASISQDIFEVNSDSTKTLSSKEKKELSKLEAELSRLEKAKKSVNNNFEKIITSCDQLVALYEGFDRFTINQEWNKRQKSYDKTYTEFKSSGDIEKDLKWLNRTAEIFIKKDCLESEFYLTVVTLLHEMNPTPESAFKMGKRQYAKKKYSEAISYFKEAFENESSDNIKKSKYAFYTAAASALVGSNSTARNYAQKAAEFRKNWGDPYILIGKLYAQTASKCGTDPASKKAGYWAAIDKFQLAKRIDKKSEREANKLISDYSKRVPTKSLWRDNVQNPDSKTYQINCWYKETVRVRF